METASNGEEGLQKAATSPFDQILCDIRMPRMDGLEFLREIQKTEGEATIIVMSAYGTVDIAIEAMKLGAYDYISKPFKPDEIIPTLREAEEREQLRRENQLLRSEVAKEYSFENILTKNEKMQKIFDVIRKVSQFKSTVLITGESGTGKELVARALHYNSDRSQTPFMGFPHLRGSGSGDQLCRVTVEVPTKLSAKQKELLREFDCLSKEECTPIAKGFFDKVKELFADKKPS